MQLRSGEVQPLTANSGVHGMPPEHSSKLPETLCSYRKPEPLRLFSRATENSAEAELKPEAVGRLRILLLSPGPMAL